MLLFRDLYQPVGNPNGSFIALPWKILSHSILCQHAHCFAGVPIYVFLLLPCCASAHVYALVSRQGKPTLSQSKVRGPRRAQRGSGQGPSDSKKRCASAPIHEHAHL